MAKLKPYPKYVLWRVRRELRWKAAAWHVAGHAVVRLALGYAVKRASLTPDHPTRCGLCELYPNRGRTRPGRLTGRDEARIIGLLASGEARLLCNGHGRNFRLECDYQEAAKLAHALCETADEAAELLARLRGEAGRLVALHRRAIYRVAEALLAADGLALTGRQIAAIVRQDDTTPWLGSLDRLAVPSRTTAPPDLRPGPRLAHTAPAGPSW